MAAINKETKPPVFEVNYQELQGYKETENNGIKLYSYDSPYFRKQQELKADQKRIKAIEDEYKANRSKKDEK